MHGRRKPPAVAFLSVIEWPRIPAPFLEIAKGSWGPEDKVDTAFIKKMLKDYGYEDLPFTASELLIFWQKR